MWMLPTPFCEEGKLQTLEDYGSREENPLTPLLIPLGEAVSRARGSLAHSLVRGGFNRDVVSVLHNSSIFRELAQFLDRDFSHELGIHSMFPLLQCVEFIFLRKLLTHLSVTCLVVTLS